MINFTLNGKTVQGQEGEYLLQVAARNGIEIPTLCHHKALEPAGMCRLCIVEMHSGKRVRYVTACNYPVWEGMEIRTDTEQIHKIRKLIVELLLARCPNVKIIKELAHRYGIDAPRFAAEDDTCILCGICTRICERMGHSAISLTGRGVEMKVDTPVSDPDRSMSFLRCLCIGLSYGTYYLRETSSQYLQRPGKAHTLRLRNGS